MESYILLERALCQRFKVEMGGVSEYISRLNNARCADGRDETLARLVKYREMRNRIAHEPSVIKRETDATREDLIWLRRFRRTVRRSRDPLSRYIRGERRALRLRRLRGVLIGALLILLALAAVIILNT